MKYPWLAVGAKVIYLGRLKPPLAYIPNQLVAGQLYTVREIFLGSAGQLTICVEEVSNPKSLFDIGYREPGFAAERFRPLVTPGQRQTVEALRNLMLDATVRGKVEA